MQEEVPLLLQCSLVGTKAFKSSNSWEDQQHYLGIQSAPEFILLTNALRPTGENGCPNPYFCPRYNRPILPPFYNLREQPVNSMTWRNLTQIKLKEKTTRNSLGWALRQSNSTDKYVKGKEKSTDWDEHGCRLKMFPRPLLVLWCQGFQGKNIITIKYFTSTALNTFVRSP